MVRLPQVPIRLAMLAKLKPPKQAMAPPRASARGPLNVNIELPATFAANRFMKTNCLERRTYHDVKRRDPIQKFLRTERACLRSLCAPVYLPVNNTRKTERKLRAVYYLALPVLIRRLSNSPDQNLIWGIEDLYYDLLCENRSLRNLSKPIRLSIVPITEERRRAYYAGLHQLSTMTPADLQPRG